MTEPRFDDPNELAGHIAAQPKPLVIGLDVDGVLAPIVAHADDARLSDGIGELLDQLETIGGVTVAVVSGRSLTGLEQFCFPAALTVIGGHGGEVRGEPGPALDGAEQRRYDLLGDLAERAASEAGRGAWVENKPMSVVLHIREAEPDSGRRALESLAAEAADVPGVKATPGNEVLELFARPASKARAMEILRDHHRPATIVYVGDDKTDEDAFAALRPADVAIKVGAGPTAASRCLRDPGAVVAWLRAIVIALGDT
jgi:trehalose 6-phosphate phosphatase